MKTKEEIWNNLKHKNVTLREDIYDAMDEYANQQCAEQRKVSAEVYTDMARFQYHESIEIAILKTEIPK